MKYYTEPSREIPVAAETEVLVVGGGPAGFGAALHAARMGRKTMLIEQYGAGGGGATIGPAARTAAALKSCAKRHATVKRSRSSIRKNCVF